MNYCKAGKKEYMTGKISPMRRTIFLIIPIVNLFILYDLFKAIISYGKIKKVHISGTDSPGSFLFLYLVLRFLGGGIIPFQVFTILLIQSTFNKVWKKTDKRPIKKWPYISEWTILILGLPIIFLLLITTYTDLSEFLPTVYIEEAPQYIEDSCNNHCTEFFNRATHYSIEYDLIEEEYGCYCLNEFGGKIGKKSYPGDLD